MHRVGREADQVFMKLPPELDELIDYRFPDCLWVAGMRHSEECYTIWVLDLDYRYYEMRAHRALDYHWTLSPVGQVWDTAETVGKAWRSR